MKIIVLEGGESAERDVSLRSGKAVYDALLLAGYETELLELTTNLLPNSIIQYYDVAFPVLHGKYGEDGTLQQELDRLDIRYVGSGQEASRLCFNKDSYKKFLQTYDIVTPTGQIVNYDSFIESDLSKKPYILKPNDGGSSIDMLVARDPDLVTNDQLNHVFSVNPQMLYEELVEGVEITVAVVGNRALQVIEIIPPQGKEFDYENKYNGETQELCPAVNVSPDIQNQAQSLALKIHNLTKCRHYSRTDMIIRDNEIFVLETNTLPGMTEQSLVPKAAAAAGLAMPELVSELVQLASPKE